MKYVKFLLIVAISFIPVWILAKQVSPETAKQVAETRCGYAFSYEAIRSRNST